LALELLSNAGVALPAYRAIRFEDSTLSQAVPVERYADLVIELEADQPAFGIVVEVQLSTDPDKHYSWPLYAATLRSRLRAPVCVLVVTADATVAAWAGTAIELGTPGCTFVPVVVGPGTVPRVTKIEQARQAPELAVLSVLAHGGEDIGLDIALATIAAAAGLDNERAALYTDLAYAALNHAARAALEEDMDIRNWEWKSPFVKKWVAFGKAEDVLAILDARGIHTDEETRARIRGCTDPVVLDHWVRRAATADALADVLDA